MSPRFMSKLDVPLLVTVDSSEESSELLFFKVSMATTAAFSVERRDLFDLRFTAVSEIFVTFVAGALLLL